MKISIALVAALAASANASPVRLIVASEPDAESFDINIINPDTEFPRLSSGGLPLDQQHPGVVAEKKPCHGTLSTFLGYMGWNSASRSSATFPSPPSAHHRKKDKGKGRFAKDESRLKFKHKHHANLINEQQRHGLLDTLRSYFPGYTPYLLGGAAASSSIPSEHSIPHVTSEELNTVFRIDLTPDIEWWRPAEGGHGKWEVKKGMGKWHAAKKGEKPPRSGKHKDRKSKDFFRRLRRSLHNFTFLESVAISLVIGAGVGSIACLIMMLFILCCRRLGLSILSGPRFGFGSKSGMSKEMQNAITEADCQQMVSEKEGQVKGQGGIKLFERDEVIPEGTRFEDEHLPEYEEGEDAPFIKEKDLGV
ncbi:hypothetical protein AYX14_01365 [Cryptococcus neoformans]|nr:hypothetical protein AYX14_01365 [Cryptococcus neoformans var. grubii]